MLKIFRDAEKRKGMNTILYDDPEATTLASPMVLKELNARLKEDPTYVLPDGFVKCEQKDLIFKYDLPQTLEKYVDEKFIICYYILDYITLKALNFHLIEPLS